MKMNKKEMKAAGDQLEKLINKDLGKLFKRKTNLIGSAKEKLKIGETLTTGFPDIDSALCEKGGLPLGCICEIYGKEGSGKGVFCMKLIEQAQKQGRLSMWIDAENQLNKEWMAMNGVNVEDENSLKIMNCDTGKETAEVILETVLKGVKSGLVSLVVVDSIAALIPEAEMHRAIGDRKVGALANVLSDGLRKIMSAVRGASCTVIFINQIREKIGVLYGNPEDTPGGRAVKFFSSLRIQIHPLNGASDKISQDGEQIGRNSRLKTIKNRFYKPNQMAVFPIYFTDFKPNPLDLLMEEGRNLKIIGKRGVFKYKDIKAETLSELADAIEFNGVMNDFGQEFHRKLMDTKDHKISPGVQECLDEILSGSFQLEKYREQM